MPCLWIGHDAAGDDLGKEAIWCWPSNLTCGELPKVHEWGKKRNELSRPKCKPETRWDEGVRSGCRVSGGGGKGGDSGDLAKRMKKVDEGWERFRNREGIHWITSLKTTMLMSTTSMLRNLCENLT